MTVNNIAARQLRTALDAAMARAEVARQQWERLEKARRAEERRAAFASRLDASTWTVWRRGAVWYAEHAGTDNFFAFARVGGLVECISASGHGYTMPLDGSGCSCPAQERSGNCKHRVAYRACQQAAVSEGLRLVTAVPPRESEALEVAA